MDALFRDMALPMGEEDGELFAELVRSSVLVNPRGIKRVFNSLQLLISMADARQDRLAIRILFAVLCLQIGFETVYKWLLGRAEALTEADLLALENAGEESRDSDLRDAWKRIPEARQGDFAPFVRAFLRCVQDPDGPQTEIDKAELERIRGVLKLSRVTSVQGQPASVPKNDPEFRWRNRQLMTQMRELLEQRLADDIAATDSNFWINTAHQTSNVYLRRYVTRDGSLTLVLDHGETDVTLYVEGGNRALRAHADLLRELLTPIASPFEDGGDEGPLFLRKPMARMSLEAREQVLKGEVADAYLRAQEAMREPT